jgi:hypothetical protein
MANYNVGHAKHVTAAAGVADTLTFTTDPHSFEVINRGTGTLWFNKWGVATAEGDDCEVVPAGASLIVSSKEKATTLSVLVEGGGQYSVVTR